jgi:uncharacterized surface protein with fasciclin (FAS1) repeats
MSESMSPSADTMAGPVGAGCADYAKAVPSGAGSVDGMAQDPVAVAASNNPLLKTLVAAVSGKVNPKVNLVDTLNRRRLHRLRARWTRPSRRSPPPPWPS